ncbi:hypothetical protein DFH07DRAFT_141998 [Mycena maculata]|uniref:Uncharacterized protein n=1 Tax=Mycena maculata TaxID=230809 RepID=A0AAD7I1E1_9AGAR|nr:hypothetical protein DFH07DRAFT_141998 [Mycena maculata]
MFLAPYFFLMHFQSATTADSRATWPLLAQRPYSVTPAAARATLVACVRIPTRIAMSVRARKFVTAAALKIICRETARNPGHRRPVPTARVQSLDSVTPKIYTHVDASWFRRQYPFVRKIGPCAPQFGCWSVSNIMRKFSSSRRSVRFRGVDSTASRLKKNRILFLPL